MQHLLEWITGSAKRKIYYHIKTNVILIPTAHHCRSFENVILPQTSSARSNLLVEKVPLETSMVPVTLLIAHLYHREGLRCVHTIDKKFAYLDKFVLKDQDFLVGSQYSTADGYMHLFMIY